jgi:hypothetical protein
MELRRGCCRHLQRAAGALLRAPSLAAAAAARVAAVRVQLPPLLVAQRLARARSTTVHQRPPAREAAAQLLLLLPLLRPCWPFAGETLRAGVCVVVVWM